MSLRDLPLVKPLYLLPGDDLVGEVLIPGLNAASRYDCMMGYFGSAALRELAPGLAEFLARPGSAMRLLISPSVTAEDRIAMEVGASTPAEVLLRALENAYGRAAVDSTALVQHTLRCLAYLVASERLQIKVVIVRDGLFHPKVWLLGDDSGYSIAVHGSSNHTAAGLARNVEQVSVAKGWAGEDASAVVARFEAYFSTLWDGPVPNGVSVFPFPEALSRRLVRDYRPMRAPSPDDYLNSLPERAASPVTAAPLRRPAGFELPHGLEYQTGDFAHQGKAIIAWEEAGRRGILEMATGSGKTISSFVAAHRLWQAEQSPILIVIAAPYLPLVAQWAREAERFGLRPVVPGEASDRAGKLALVQKAVRALRLGTSAAECLVITHDFLADPDLAAELGRLRTSVLLIADEAHNLGTARFLAAAPEAFRYRLALSATPIRQYDAVGTAGLVAYFGEVVYRFGLEQAIGTCLVPYRYHLHEVPLADDELEEWVELTERLRSSGWRQDAETGRPSDYVQRLLSQRRKVLEQARNKVAVLDRVLRLQDRRAVRHTLVYASDKGRDQLREVNRLLMDTHGLRVHQITQEETGDPELSARLLADFSRGDGIQVLTAMRVLDEGVDIPEVTTAHILASTTVERQWVQRRGRVLRKCSRTGKESATIHDYIVVPPETLAGSAPSEISGLLRGELERAREFAALALNAGAADGPLRTISDIIHRYF